MKRFDSVQKWLVILFSLSLVTTMSGMEVFGSLLIVIFFVRIAVDSPYRQSLTLPPLAIPLLVFSLCLAAGVLLGSAGSDEKWRDIGRLRFFFLYCLLYWELCRQRKPGHLPSWVSPLTVVCAIVAVYGVVQHFIPLDLLRPEGKKIYLYAIPEKKLGPLVLGPFNHHLTFANIFMMYAALFLALGLSRIPRWASYAAIGTVLSLCTIWTNSRSAWLALPLVLLFLGWQKSKKVAGLFLVGTLFVLVGTNFIDAGFRERQDRTIFQRDELYNGDQRYRLWHANFEMFKEHPFLGIGWNNNERLAPIYVDKLYPHVDEKFYGHAHSTPLQILSTTGLLGTLAYFWIWGTLAAVIVRARKRFVYASLDYWILAGCSAAFVAFWIQGMTQWNFGDAEVLYNLVFFWAVATALGTPRKERELRLEAEARQ